MSEVAGAPMLGPGSIIGAYEILEEIGKGGLGVVYRGQHVHLGRIVAIKLLHPYWTASSEFVSRFREEGRVMALLEHPNILRVHDAGEAEGRFYLAMGFIQGRTLEDYMLEGVPLDRAIRITRQMADALAYAHKQGVVHRDVKPANIMVDEEGNATLTDFGVARLRGSPGVTLPGVQVGTPFYMAPEQVLGKPIDGRADIYALGVILYQMVSGRLPFPGPDTDVVFQSHIYQEPPPLEDELPNWLRRIIGKALAKSPDDRFSDAVQFKNALESGGDEEAMAQAGLDGAMVTTGIPAQPVPRSDTGIGQTTALKKRERTALSLDVVGSSRLKQPGMTMAVTHQFALFREYIRKYMEQYGCLIYTWSGDGLLALFTRASDGAGCAASILEGLAQFNASVDSSRSPIRVRIGLHKGAILMSDDQPLGEVTSSTLDAAGHLQKACPADSALASKSVILDLPDASHWPPLGTDWQFDFQVYQFSRDAVVPVLKVAVTGAGGDAEFEIQTEALIGRANSQPGSRPQIPVSEDDAVSRRHARLYPENGAYFVEDLDSTNGTVLNGQWLRPSTPTELQVGDTIEVGETTKIKVMSVEPR